MDFTAKNRSHAASFAEQQRLIKEVFSGKTVLCQHCQQPLKLLAPAKTTHKANSKMKAKGTNISNHTDKNPTSDAPIYGIRCQKTCTDIELDFI
ncbi:hypothetical protein FJQ87_08970 [Shewanella sp. SNU WT4]|uniref:hypothetical protein n=1 Tax=Shewanella sp. SNU WT4 TaxID=2590015 RepID=UPI00112EF2FB|nr:hypothetical protein [Shewanella sp. SNU WT4]QDF66824.1 hypothetical protein FJQ87_08970 [Shewanella sp. SNU WT4]